MALYLFALSFYERPKELKKGIITQMWVEPPRHDVRLRSPGVWEEAWLPERCMMEIQDVNKPRRRRTIEVHPSMMTTHKELEWIVLADSAEHAKQMAEAAKIDTAKQNERWRAHIRAQERKLRLY